MINLFLSYYKDLEPQLKKAGIKKSLLEYAKEAYTYSIIIAAGISILLFFSLFILLVRIVRAITPIVIFIPVITAIVGFILGLFVSMMLFRAYPSFIISDKEKKINNSLYIATIYMATMASAGMNPYSIFTLFTTLEEFGELKREIREIVEMVEVLGIPFPEALRIKAENTSSKKLAELLEGMRSIIVSGGSLERYLYEKANQYSEEFKRNLIEYSNTLQVILEIYITLVIVGVVFVIIITALMGAITGFSAQIQMLQLMSILAILPLSTVFLVIMIKSINPFQY